MRVAISNEPPSPSSSDQTLEKETLILSRYRFPCKFSQTNPSPHSPSSSSSSSSLLCSYGRKNHVNGGDFARKTCEPREFCKVSHWHPFQTRIAARTETRTSSRRPRSPHRVPPFSLRLPLRSLQSRSQICHRVRFLSSLFSNTNDRIGTWTWNVRLTSVFLFNCCCYCFLLM